MALLRLVVSAVASFPLRHGDDASPFPRRRRRGRRRRRRRRRRHKGRERIFGAELLQIGVMRRRFKPRRTLFTAVTTSGATATRRRRRRRRRSHHHFVFFLDAVEGRR